MSKVDDVRNCRQKRKLDLIKVLGGKCQICGFDLFPSALEFHHENPEEKEYSLSNRTLTLEQDLKEIKKCFLLCANCHRGVHNNYYQNPKNHIFIEEIAQKLIQEKEELAIKHYKYCKDCGKEIDSGAIRCQKCAAIAQRKAVRPNREELKDMIRELPFTQIGKGFGVSDNAVRKWCINVGLPSKRTDIKAISDEDWKNI